MATRPGIALVAGLAFSAAFAILIAYRHEGGAARRSEVRRSPQHPTPADAVGTGDNSGHSAQASDAAAPIGPAPTPPVGTAVGHTSTRHTAWNPRMVDVPGWGTVAIDVVAMGTAALRGQHDRAIKLLLADEPPQIALRLRPKNAASLKLPEMISLSDALTVSLSGRADGLQPVASREIKTESLMGFGDDACVVVVPVTLRGLADVTADEGRRVFRLAVQPRFLPSNWKGQCAFRDIEVLMPLSSPGMGPAAPIGSPASATTEETPVAEVYVQLNHIVGVRRASLRMYYGNALLPATILETELANRDGGLAIPTPDLVECAQLTYRVLVRPGWWEMRSGLRIDFEVWDDGGKRHTLAWRPQAYK